MKIKDIIQKTPEITEEKLLEFIKERKEFLAKYIIDRIKQSRKDYITSDEQLILNEWDNIQAKQSYLTKSERDKVCALVSVCLIKMVKSDGGDN